MLNITNLHPISINNLIRIGRDNDGGYIVPKVIIDKCDGLISYGINKDWSFEIDFLERRNNINVHCYDHTLNLSSLIKFTFKSILLCFIYIVILDKKRLNKSFYGISVIKSYFQFFRQRTKHFRKRIWNNNDGINKTVDSTIEKIQSEGSRQIFIKMDIEGAEFKVLNKMNSSKVNILGLAIEFHDINSKSKEFNTIIDGLRKTFHIAHIHGNNYSKVNRSSNFPSSVEITFINKKLLKGTVKKSNMKYPIKGLDQPNRHSKPDTNLSFS